MQDKPRLFSTFMMWLLAELYHTLPEAGDLDKPKLVFFFDEAHLLFNDASKAFLEQVEQVVRLIRSKGVGVYFVTQTPKDVPADVLAQLGNRVQHALRAHTPDDETALKAAVRTFPRTEFYDLAGDPHLARHRRGGGHGARSARGADAGRGRAAHPAGLAHGAAHTGGAAGGHPAVRPARRIRHRRSTARAPMKCWRRGSRRRPRRPPRPRRGRNGAGAAPECPRERRSAPQ